MTAQVTSCPCEANFRPWDQSHITVSVYTICLLAEHTLLMSSMYFCKSNRFYFCFCLLLLSTSMYISCLVVCILKLSGDFPGLSGLRLHAPKAGGPSSIPGQGTRSHMLKLRTHMPQLKREREREILHASTKTWHNQINDFFNKIKQCLAHRRCSINTC